MFREMHYMDRGLRTLDLAEKIAERRRQSLAASSKPSRGSRMTRMLFALAVTTENAQAESRA